MVLFEKAENVPYGKKAFKLFDRIIEFVRLPTSEHENLTQVKVFDGSFSKSTEI